MSLSVVCRSLVLGLLAAHARALSPDSCSQDGTCPYVQDLSEALAEDGHESEGNPSLSLLQRSASLQTKKVTQPNMMPNLAPAHGAWRGIAPSVQSQYKPSSFKDTYGASAQMIRTFPAEGTEAIGEDLRAWIENEGGILFYTIQPKGPGCWKTALESPYTEQIKKYAQAVNSVAPHQVLVAAGFEPDGHMTEKVGEAKGYGTAEDYKKMYAHFVDVFEKEGVKNAVWAVDYAEVSPTSMERLKALWPENKAASWLMWNYFQGNEASTEKGNCHSWISTQYGLLQKAAEADMPEWAHAHWGLGAWGTKKYTWASLGCTSQSCVEVSLPSREACIEGMKQILQDKEKYPKLSAQVYYGAKDVAIDTKPDNYFPSLIARLSDIAALKTVSETDGATPHLS